MRSLKIATCALIFLAGGAASVTSCDDDDVSISDGGQGSIDAAQDTVGQADVPRVNAAASCLDRPGELPRPPTAGLPCELIPPGLSL